MSNKNWVNTVCVALCVNAATAFAAGTVDLGREVQFQIPAQRLSDAVIVFSDQTGIQVVTAGEDLTKLSTAGVSGKLAISAGLRKLLEGTELRFETVGDSTVAVMGAARADSVNPREQPRPASTAASAPKHLLQGTLLAQADANQETAQTSAPQDNASTPEKLEEITVTAQKRLQSVQDVPMSITAISGEKLAAAGISNALDLSHTVPSLAVTETGPGRQIISIRGISNTRGSSSLTGVYLDEMPVTGAQDGFVAAYADIRILDLDRVEVLKGPQGTLFGEGSVGGTIRFITKDPDLTRAGGQVSTEFSDTTGGGWTEGVDGVINVPLVDDKLGVRVAASYQDNSGWIDQPSVGRKDINDSKVKHARLKALFAPTAQLKIKGLVEIHRNDGGASNIVNQAPQDDSIFLQAFDRSAPTDFTDRYDLYNLAVTYDFGFAELLSSTSHAKFASTQSFTQMLGQAPVPYLEVLMRDYTHDATITAQELRLTSTANGQFKWTLGANYKDDKLIKSWRSGYDAVLFGGAVAVSGISAGLEPTTKSKSWAGFGDASYALSGRLEVGAGLRYFHDRREAFDPAQPALETLSDDFSRLTFRTYARYDVSSDVNLYVNIANGFRSGGFNDPGVGPRGGPVSFDPEKSIFYEAGMKTSLLDRRVRLNAAVFYGKFKGMQEAITITSPVDGQLLQFTSNSQDARLQGVEWDISWAALDRLTLTLAGDVTDSKVTWVDPADQAPLFKVGDPVNQVPDYSVSVGTDYVFRWSAAVPGSFLLSFDRKGKSYFTSRSTVPVILEPQTSAPEVNFLNASLGAEWSGWKWSLFGRNLLDERKIVNAAESGWTAQARPRTVGLSLAKSF